MSNQSLENRNGLLLDHKEKKATINPFPHVDNPFGTLAYIVIKNLTFVMPPQLDTVLEIIDPDTARMVRDENWIIEIESIEGDTTDIDDEIEADLPNLIENALATFNRVETRLTRNNIDYQRYRRNI